MCTQPLASSCKLLFSGTSGNSRQTPLSLQRCGCQSGPPPTALLPACLEGDCPLSPAVRTAGGWRDGCMAGQWIRPATLSQTLSVSHVGQRSWRCSHTFNMWSEKNILKIIKRHFWYDPMAVPKANHRSKRCFDLSVYLQTEERLTYVLFISILRHSLESSVLAWPWNSQLNHWFKIQPR